MSEPASLRARMRAAAVGLIAGLDEHQRALCRLPFADQGRCRFTYLPRSRPGVCLADLDRPGHKAAQRLLATGLSPSAYAQAAAVMALEEVLDRREGWRRGRHANDYWVVIFGDPAGSEPWAWRWEGHHLSVSVTIDGAEIFVAPLFLGAHPARVSVAGWPVIRPFGVEEDLAHTLLEAMRPAARGLAVVASSAPSDIRSSTLPSVLGQITPLGVGAGQMDPASRALLEQLTTVYLSRLPEDMAVREATGLPDSDLHFAWEGPIRQGSGHYYRIQAEGLLIEYDNTSHDANHVHTVLRRPGRDFGGQGSSAGWAGPAADHE